MDSFFDVITGDITGPISPDDDAYATNVANPSTKIFFTFDESNWIAEDGGIRVMRWTVPVADMSGDHYVRVRGTNLPQGTPFETDADGNPLSDNLADNIPCPYGSTSDVFDPAVCPDHLPINAEGIRVLGFDVEAWADLWFYANPIYINVRESGRRT